MVSLISKYVDPKITVGNLLTICAMVTGGIWFLAQTDARIAKMEGRVGQVETTLRDTAAAAAVKEDRAVQKVESVTRDLNDMKVAIKGIQTSVEFLVQQERNRQR